MAVPEIRVSFQGGGALMAAMIPIAHALRDAEVRGYVRIGDVAGTSAGSVAGALLASHGDFANLRTYLDTTLPADARLAVGQFRGRLGAGKLVWGLIRIVGGWDVIPLHRQRAFFLSIFRAAGVELAGKDTADRDLTDYGKTGLPTLSITRSSLDEAKLQVMRSGPVIDAILDSCAIPFILRGYRTARLRPHVDGGLCENLPISGFDLDDNIPILAVSVDTDPEQGQAAAQKRNLFSFFMQLFSTSIGHNVARSKEIVGRQMTIEERVPFAFHQVEEAVAWLRDRQNYDKVYDRAYRRVLDFAQLQSNLKPEGRLLTGRNTVRGRDRQLHLLLQDDYDADAFSAESASLHVSCESLRNPDPKSYRSYDIVAARTRCCVKKPGARLYRSQLRRLEQGIHPTTWSVTNVTRNQPVRFSAFHYRDDPNTGDQHDPCFLRFDQPHDDFAVGDILEVEFVYLIPPGMLGLDTEKRDFIAFNNVHAHAIPMEIILTYPAVLGTLVVDPSPADATMPVLQVMDRTQLERHCGIADVSTKPIGVRSEHPVPPKGKIKAWFARP